VSAYQVLSRPKGEKKKPNPTSFLALLAFLALSISPSFASLPEGVEQSAQPSWVENIEVDLWRDKARHGEYGITYLLHDRQEFLPEKTSQLRQTFIRNLWSFDNTSGVADSSNINISFDPSYEQLSVTLLNIVTLSLDTTRSSMV